MPEPPKNRNKSKKAQGWEEAGGEFYQESYHTDCEGLPKNTFSITTLLPSKQNRFGTVKRAAQYNPQELKNSKCWHQFSTTTQRFNKHNDVHFSILPDLSQVLTNEEHIWEEMFQIKLMPVSMQQKKEFKHNLQSATKLRLQGFNQLKWKHRKAWQKIGLKWNKLVAKLGLWQSSLKQIEGHFGTGVVAYFLFLRWLFYLNCLTFLMIFIFIIMPNLIQQQNAAGQCNTELESNASSKCLPAPSRDGDDKFSVLDLVQGTGVLQNSLIFYGAYSNKVLGLEEAPTNTNGTDQPSVLKSKFHYDLPLAYVFVAVAYLVVALVAIVKAAAREFRDRLINGKWQFYQHCNLVFGGWDFCIHNEKSASTKHNAVYNEISSSLQSKRIEIERNNRSKDYIYKLIVTRIIINLAIFSILLMSAYLIYFLFNVSLQHSNYFDKYSISAQSYLTSNNSEPDADVEADEDANLMSKKLTEFIFDFMPYIAIVCLNLFLPTIFNYMCKFEKYSPLFVVKISLLRTIFLRLASLAILLSRFYYIVVPQSKSHGHRVYNCWETFVGQQFYKLVITDFVSHLLVTFCINFPRALAARKINHNFVKFIGEQEFELPKHVLDIVYSQTICWLGGFYTPLLPAMVALITFCMFYIKKFQCLVNSKPSKILYGASRSNSLFMLILLISYFVAVAPLTYAFAEISPSIVCGPFQGLHSVWDAPVATFMSMPTLFKNFIFFFGTAAFAVPSFVLLILLLYYFYAVSDANKNMVEVLKNQLVLEGHDKQFLLTRLSALLKQHQDVQE